MRRLLLAFGGLCLSCFAATAGAEAASPLDGVWTLNRSLSELPREIGFNVIGLPSPGSAGQGGGSVEGGRGRRGSAGGGRVPAPNPYNLESQENAKRVQLANAEARNPPARLMIVDTPAAVTMTNELGQSRVFHPTGKDESLETQTVPLSATTARDGDRLVVIYHIERHREVRYTYSHAANAAQLVVDIQFLENGSGDKGRLIYEPGVATETAPAAASSARETFDARPGAELKGLRNLGILVEDLSTQAVACGLNHDTIETALSTRLTGGGFTVHKNSDEDTYVYVNVMTNRLADGTCVSRYDAFLYTHATANLSYREQPVLVQVSLMHRGGIGASAAATHAAAVARGLENYVDLFVTQIHEANK